VRAIGDISRNAIAAAYSAPIKEGGSIKISEQTLLRAVPPTISWTGAVGIGWIYSMNVGPTIFTRETSYTLSTTEWAAIQEGLSFSIELFASRVENDCVVEGPYRVQGSLPIEP
jgi:hypothetical protein